MPINYAYDQVVNNLSQSRQLNTYRYPSPESVASVIQSNYENNSVSTYVFPGDIPKHHFTIYEYEITGANKRDLRQIYVLPLPQRMVDSKQIMYNDDFNIIGSIGALTAMAGGALGGPLGRVIAGVGAAGAAAAGGIAKNIPPALTGGSLSVNNLNMVTLDMPRFQQFTLDFIFAPKTFKESQEVNNIIFNLKKYSHPSGALNVNIGGNTLSLALWFPRIYLMAFNPSSKYLYKFKPCVIEMIQVNYSHAGIPTFYKVDGESVPESVSLHLQCKELEVWTQENFKGGVQTSDPFDSINNREWLTPGA